MYIWEKESAMITDKQRRNQIWSKVQKMPSDRLKKLHEYIKQLEKSSSGKRKVLSYAGTWKDLDNELFKELTDNLISNRQRNKRRFDE